MVVDDVDAVRDEDLQDMYLNASMADGSSSNQTTTAESHSHPHPAEGAGDVAEEKAANQPVTKSRYTDMYVVIHIDTALSALGFSLAVKKSPPHQQKRHHQT